jgi:hypothetical protein
VRLLPVAGLACALVTALACAEDPDTLNAQMPGDPCYQVCPEGMTCRGTTYQKKAIRRRPGSCDLDPGRCVTDADCRRSERCFRPSEKTGLCTAAPQL